MSDHGNTPDTRVTSSIHGGQPTTVDLDQLTGVVNLLNGAASTVNGMNRAWSEHAGSAKDTAWQVSLCGRPAPDHDAAGLRALGDSCDAIAANHSTLGDDMDTLADKAVRAHGLYSDAERLAAEAVTREMKWKTMLDPANTLHSFLKTGLSSFIKGSYRDGKPNPFHIFHDTDGMQEGLLAGIGRLIAGPYGSLGPVSDKLGFDMGHDTPVNNAATVLSLFTGRKTSLLSGAFLEVTEVQPHAGDIGPARDIGEAMRHMDGIADGTTVPYGTVALQEYRQADGTRSWLLTVPGTDNEGDTAIGWAQNVELMSSNRHIRMNAESARLAVAALKDAGVAPDEPIAIVGHSQGGIVAGTLAAGLEGQYNVSHIVTAGSPIANHPIPESTYVTSIETTGELVSNLDGGRNPVRDTWLTIRGQVHEPGATDEGTAVEGASPTRELAHGRNYMHAAYRDADELGSPALREHQEHFAQIVDGEYAGTRYYQGRITYPLHEQVKENLRDAYLAEEERRRIGGFQGW